MSASFDPKDGAASIAAKIATRSRHVCVLLGAGAPKAAGLPDLAGLQAEVVAKVGDRLRDATITLLSGRNIEAGLSRLRRISSLLAPGESFGGFDRDGAVALDKAICRAIVESIDGKKADLTPFIDLARWATGDYYQRPIEIFTINYDTLIERGLEAVATTYFDGFVGNIQARFQPSLIDRTDSATSGLLPSSFVRVWKLHGSVNWSIEPDKEDREVTRLGVSVSPDQMAAIYPSDEKYDDSRRVPFVVLMDRFTHALAERETVLIVNGYSFGDEHVNEIIFEAALRHPRSETIILCHAAAPVAVAEKAEQLRNLTVFASKEAIWGGTRRTWVADADIPGIWEGGKFLLGDFSRLGTFLSRSRQPDG